MAYFYDRADQDKAADAEVRDRREAASMCLRIKPVLASFDGKCYNCRVEKKLQEIGPIYAEKTEYYISFTSSEGNKSRLLCSVPLAEGLDGGKRIKADVFIHAVNEQREKLLKEAYEIEKATENIDYFINRFKDLEKAVDGLRNQLPYAVQDIYNLGLYVKKY